MFAIPKYTGLFNISYKNVKQSTNIFSGCSVARLSRRVWDAEVAGSNPATPTIKSQKINLDFLAFLFDKGGSKASKPKGK